MLTEIIDFVILTVKCFENCLFLKSSDPVDRAISDKIVEWGSKNELWYSLLPSTLVQPYSIRYLWLSKCDLLLT